MPILSPFDGDEEDLSFCGHERTFHFVRLVEINHMEDLYGSLQLLGLQAFGRYTREESGYALLVIWTRYEQVYGGSVSSRNQSWGTRLMRI